MNEKIHRVLCSINEKLARQGLSSTGEAVHSTIKAVGISDATPQPLVAQNAARVELWIYNGGDKKLFLAPYNGLEVGPNLYSLTIKPEETLIMNPDRYGRLYDQKVVGFWADNATPQSVAMITEFYT